MPRFNYEMTPQKIHKWLVEEGRGKGIGKDYIPFIQTIDISPNSLSTRDLGIKTNRIHHTLSKWEDYFLSMIQLNRAVLDIREQFPLLPQDETKTIAKLLSVKHPASGNPRTDIVMTTDFLITLTNDKGMTWNIARTIKPKEFLSNFRTLEKFEIERLYWKSRGVDWGIIVAEDIPIIYAKNCEILGHYYLPDRIGLSLDVLNKIYSVLTPLVREETLTLAKASKECNRRLGCKQSESLSAAHHFIATGRWIVNLETKFDPGKQLHIEMPKE
jgi:hypothetical protein